MAVKCWMKYSEKFVMLTCMLPLNCHRGSGRVSMHKMFISKYNTCICYLFLCCVKCCSYGHIHGTN